MVMMLQLQRRKRNADKWFTVRRLKIITRRLTSLLAASHAFWVFSRNQAVQMRSHSRSKNLPHLRWRTISISLPLKSTRASARMATMTGRSEIAMILSALSLPESVTTIATRTCSMRSCWSLAPDSRSARTTRSTCKAPTRPAAWSKPCVKNTSIAATSNLHRQPLWHLR